MFSLKKTINMRMIENVKKNNIFIRAQTQQHISNNNKKIKNVTAPNVSKIINTNTSTNNAGLLIKAGVNSGNEILLAQKANGTNVFLVDASGNIGIGTNNPLAKLEVKASGDGDLFIARYSAGAAKLIYGYQTGSDGYLELRTGADNIVTKLSGY